MKGKRVITIMTLVLLTCPLWGQQVSKEVAMKKAYSFVTAGHGDRTDARRSMKQTPQLELANSGDELYVFNDVANGGFVVISGDERMPDVLAYADEGRYDEEDCPENMLAWFDGYAQQIAYLRAHPEAKVALRRAPERKNIPQLLNCWFNQSAPYNNKCPKQVTKRCLTGCVATAMAQIMHYYQWPKQTTKKIPSYTTPTNGIKVSAIPITEIDWPNVLRMYLTNYNYSQEKKDAVATLMLLCGAAAKMDYGFSQSSASLSDAMDAMEEYFSYDERMMHIYRDKYGLDEWEEIIYNELCSERPMLYSGYPEDEGDGHAFVIDGYTDGYFHVNWGWGGKDANVMMTGVDGWEGYTTGQHAIIGIQPSYPNSPKSYAVFDNGKMTLYFDSHQLERTGTVLPKLNGINDYREQVVECVIDSSFADYEMTSLRDFFDGWQNMLRIKGLEYLNTSKVTNMSGMFAMCRSLTTLDLSSFNTENVTDMSGMFGRCRSLTTLDLSSFNTSKVTDMNGMFSDCRNLHTLDLSSFNTFKVTKMNGMFYGCQNLQTLDLSSFNTENVTDMSYMFYYCYHLPKLDLSRFNTTKVTNMNNMFYGCYYLHTLDLSSFNTSKVTNMNHMFGCPYLETIYVGDGWDMTNVKGGQELFYCASLVGGKGTVYNKEHIDGEYARIDGGPDSPGYFTDIADKIAPADLNRDGTVDTQDVLSIYRFMQEYDGTTPPGRYDVNGDILVDTQDVLEIYKYIQEH